MDKRLGVGSHFNRTKTCWELAALAACVIAWFVLLDFAVFPDGLPRDIPHLGWKAEHDRYLYALIPKDRDTDDKFTVCLLGSSLVAKGLHAGTVRSELERTFGVSAQVYNYAVGGAYMCDFLLSLKYALKVNPDLVVIGTSLRDFPQETTNPPKTTASFELLARDDLDLPPFMARVGIEEGIAHLLKEHWSLFRYRNWIRLNAGALLSALSDPGGSRDRRFFQGRREVDWENVRGLVDEYYAQERRSYPNCQVQCLDEVILASRQSGADLLVVNMPITDVWYERDALGALKEVNDLVESRCLAAGIDYIDATRQYGNDSFIDSSHLRKEGALSFSTWLAAAMAPYHHD